MLCVLDYVENFSVITRLLRWGLSSGFARDSHLDDPDVHQCARSVTEHPSSLITVDVRSYYTPIRKSRRASSSQTQSLPAAVRASRETRRLSRRDEAE